MAKLIILDGNSLLFRAFYATYSPDRDKLMMNAEGIPTNALFAFSNMIASLLKDLNKGDGVFVAFDAGGHTFRHKEYKEYKANRPPCPTDLLTQMPIVRDFLNSLNITYYEDENIEADDIAGNIAKKAEKEGYEVEVYTSDKDYLQLIDDKITIKLIKKGLKDIRDMTPTTFKEEWGFNPIQITDYKGLMGDPSDNLKGIPKIGDKTAKKLIDEFGTLENIIDNASNIKGKVGENIKEFAEDGKMCKHLAIIRTDDELPLNISDFIYQGYNLEEINEFAQKYGLRTLLNKLPKDFRVQKSGNVKVTYTKVSNFKEIELPSTIGISVHTSEGNYHDVDLYGLLVSTGENTYYIEKTDLLNDQKLLDALKNEEIKKCAFDYKRNYCVLNQNNIEINGLEFDLLLAMYLLDSNIAPDINAVLTGLAIDISYAYKNVDSLFDNDTALIEAIEAYYSLNLKEDIIRRLKLKEQYDLLTKIEQPLTVVLAEMELEGFPVDRGTLLDLGETYREKIKILTNEIYELAGEEFNISSPKQVATILYDKLQIKGNKKNSTSVEYLKELVDVHPIIQKILDYRKYSKQLSSYIDGITPYIHEDNKIHATFNQAITATGRLSSSEPNLQNISIRDEESRQIRKAFFYDDPNMNILSLDYSQIELRILSSLADCKGLIEAFNSNEDIHSATARKVFHVPADEPLDPLLRRKAKAVNFGIIYGISDWGLATQLDIPVYEAREIIMTFYKEFPEIKEYLNNLVEFAVTKGYATTIFNRRRYLPELNSDQYQQREFAKRAAMNAPIQGSAADLIKIATIEVRNALKKGGYKAKIVNQIHDEIILKVPSEEKDAVYKLVKDIMENCVDLKVKLNVDGGYARTWFDAK